MRQAWEYHFVPMSTQRAMTEWDEIFKELGREGWELTGTLATAQGEALLFKRPA